MASTSLHTLVVGYTVHAENHSGCSRVSFAENSQESLSMVVFLFFFHQAPASFLTHKKEKKKMLVLCSMLKI